MITYPIILPVLPGFVDFAWEPESAVQVQEAEFTYQQTVYAWEGKRRKAAVTVGYMTDVTKIKAWQVAMLSLNGREGTFEMQDPAYPEHRGDLDLGIPQTPKVKGSGQTGMDLLTEGWQVSTPNLLLAGDYISIRNRLYQLLANASSDSAGDAVLTVWPHASLLLQDQDAISVGVNAVGLFRLIEFPRFAYDAEKMTNGFSFGCVEAF